MTLTINGTPFARYVAADGFKWTRNDLDSDDAGRTLDGVMHRGRIAIKAKLDISCIPLTSAQLKTVLSAIEPETVSVTYTDPQRGSERTAQFYATSVPASFLMRDRGGVERWGGVSFSLVEV